MFSVTQAAELRAYQASRPCFTGVLGPWLEHLVEDENLTLAQARELLSGWEAIQITDPVLGHMATVIKKNREIHLAIYRRFRHRSHVNAKRIREYLQPLLDANLFLVTKIDRQQDAKFIEHLGFQKLGIAPDGVWCYILNEVKYPRSRHVSTVQN